MVPSSGTLWSISAISNDLGVVVLNSNENANLSVNTYNTSIGISLALYITASVQLSGSGTQSSPYRIIN